MVMKIDIALQNLLAFLFIGIFILILILIFSRYHSSQKYAMLIDSNIVYNGNINTLGQEQLIKLLEKTGYKHFYINSRGGSSEAGLEIGKFIAENNIAVTVIGECYSACANYIFLPSKNKRAVIDARIGLHGGFQSYHAQRLSLLAKIPSEHQSMYKDSFVIEEKKILMEKILLSSAGINPEIINRSAQMTLYGETSFHVIENGKKVSYKIPKIINSNFELWFPPKNEYERWGIKIETIPDPDFKHRVIKSSGLKEILISRQSTPI